MKYLMLICMLYCGAASAQLSGRYATEGFLMIGGQDEITLNKDGTCSYIESSCLGAMIGKGTYTVSGDSIYLNVLLTYERDSSTYTRTEELLYRKRHLTSSRARYYRQKEE